mmetsp:Transcript_34298/g.33907  ORF Transcript_34298/g.33907 Transcript_34298/m.33907 type:complete len:99 (-) Transcript_34298:59-355(-)
MTEDYKLPRNMSTVILKEDGSDGLIDTRYKKKWLSELEQKEIQRGKHNFPNILKNTVIVDSLKAANKYHQDKIEKDYVAKREHVDSRERKLTALRIHK